MDDFEKIQYLRELEEKRTKLVKELEDTNRNIEQQKESCQHIIVDLGYYGLCYSSTGNKYRCLLCGKEEDEKYYFESEYIIHAENYLLQYDIKDKKQRNEKFDNIQTLALGLLRENPNMSIEELTAELNNLIQVGISYRKIGKEKVKKFHN